MTTVHGNAMKEIGQFTGNEDIECCIKHFEIAVCIDKLQSEETDALAIKLDGPAYDMWAGLNSTAQTRAESIKIALIKAYGKCQIAAWTDLLNSMLLPDKPIDVCAEQIKII